jgi:hypothetical protein
LTDASGCLLITFLLGLDDHILSRRSANTGE